MVRRVAQLRERQQLLVHSAAGGVGTAALQLGKVIGLIMFGTASKPKHPLLVELGVTPIDYRTENFVARICQLAPQGLDCVLDPIGGKNWWRSYQCLRRAGNLVCYGVPAAVSEGKSAAGFGFAALGIMKILPHGKKAFWNNVKSPQRAPRLVSRRSYPAL
jgi:NADPH2:quinone reductase